MATNPKLLRGVVPPVCTPFTSDYEVDEKSLRRLVNHLIDGGVHGLFVLGSTSEVAYLTDKRRADVIRIAIDETAGRVPVVAGAIDMTTLRVNEHVRAAVDAGIDGIVITAPFYARTHPEEIAQAFKSLKSRGLVREFGVSNYTVAQTLALNAFVDNGLATTQPQLSAAHLDPLRDGTLDLCMESGITPLAWSALAGGALATGKGVAPALLAVLDELAARENVTRSAIAIAFVLAHPSRPVAIIGTQTPSRISELALATSVSLTRTDVYAIIQASDGIPLP